MNHTREILMPHGAINKLAERLDVSLPTIRKALRYGENSDNPDEYSLARKIRYNAVKNFGGIDTGAADVKITGEVWSWDYPNGARLAINMRNGLVTLTFSGRLIETADSITTREIYDWQLKAENLRA
ncbi:MAG: hypothetical protein IKO99_12130 [Bacteroidales bacterium]|nr:hypothetical protein [Bacteroidales bacterium]